ncbi:hypothetical protein EQH57_0464, partial [Dictyocoela roeselum]
MEFTGNIMNYRKNGARISFSIKNLCDRTGNSDFINYSYVFECIESGYVLSTIPYLVQNGEKHQIFSNLSFKVKNDPEVINKIRALGGVLKDVNATYEVTDTMRLNKNCITVTWIDRCLYSLKINDKLKLFKRFKINEIQYKDESISMMNKNFSTRDNQPPKHIREEKNIVFQFTGLPTLLKTKAMEKLRALGIRYIDSMSYEGATHLIMGDINMSEKYLCTLVSGGIILGVDFIDNLDISKADQYVWNVVGLQKKELKIVMGIKYWHDRISREGLP